MGGWIEKAGNHCAIQSYVLLSVVAHAHSDNTTHPMVGGVVRAPQSIRQLTSFNYMCMLNSIYLLYSISVTSDITHCTSALF